MEKRLLLTRSRHDLANLYLYAYSEEILSDAENRGWKIDKAEDEKNTSLEVVSRLSKNKPLFVFFNGHGTENAIFGYNNELLLDCGSSSKISNTIVFARNCSALAKLGATAVENGGCTAFVGYNSEFIVPYVNEHVSAPLRDPLAKPVMEVSNLVGKHILKGDTVENSVAAAQNKAAELILKSISSKEAHDAAVFRALFNNFLALGFVGKGDAKVQ